MKRKSLKFLSVFLSVSMVLTPVSSTFAESMEVAVEQAVTAQNEAGTSVLDVSENGTEVVADSVEPTPLEEPEAPLEETETPAEEPEAPLEETETPAEEPEAPLEETETPAEETEPSAEEAETNNIPQQINDEMLPAVVSETDETSIPATSIKFNVSKKTITVGNSYSLKATVKPTDTTDTIKWSSDNATVATVDNGTITGHSTGIAVITAEIGEFKATCTVTVVNTYSVIIQTMLYKGTGAASKDVSDVNVVLQDVNGKNVESTIINNQFKFTDLDAEQKYTLKVTRNDYTLVEKSGNVYTQLSEKEYTATIDKTSDASTYTIIFQKDALTFALREVPSDYSKFQNSTVENLKQVLTSINANETNITVRNDYASKLNAALAGLKLKNGSYTTSAEVSTGMAITDLRIIVEKGSMKAQFIGTPAAYGKIYMGGKSAAKTADDTDPKMILPDNDGAIVKNSAGVEGHQYTMPVSDLATAITFSSYATARNVWTEQTVIFSSGNMDGTVSDDDNSDTIGKSYSLSVNTVIDSTRIESGMFAMDNAVATKQSDGSWLVRMHQTKENRNYMAITLDKDAATAHSVDWYVSDANYYYTIPVADLTQPLLVTFSSAANVSAGKEFGSIVRMTFDTANMTETSEVSAKESDISILPKVSKDTYTMTVNAVMDSTGEASGMYAMDNAVATKQSDGSWLVRMHQTSENRNYMAITSDKDAATAHSVDWYVSDAKYYYTIPVADLTQPLLVTFSSDTRVNQGKGFGNIVRITFDTANMAVTTESPAKEADVTILSAVSSAPETTPTPVPTQIPAEPEKPADDGKYSITVNSNATMFKIVNCVLTVKDGTYTAKVTLSGTGYDYLYMGTGEAAAADTANWISYTVEASGDFAGKYTFEIPVSALDTPIAVAAHSAKAGTWYDRTMTFDSSTLKFLEGLTPDTTPTPDATVTPTPEVTPTPDTTPVPDTKPTESGESEYVVDSENTTSVVDNSTTVSDGNYAPDSYTWSGGSGKTKIFCQKVTIVNGKAYATIQFSSDAFPQLKANGNIYTGICANGTSTYTIPVTLGKDNTVIGYSTKMKSWITYTVNPVVTENSKEPEITPTPEVTPLPEVTPTPTEKPSDPVKPGEQGNGNYSITVNSNAIMFKVINCVLKVKDGTYTANITLSGTGYDYLFMGTAAQAAASDKANYIGYKVNANGQYVYTIPVSALDKPIAVAGHATKSGEWYDRELTFDSSTMVLLKGDEATATPSPTPTPNPEDDKKADEESKYETDLSGGTSAVDSSTGLADGVYTPDKFSWSGGSGRTNITCSKVTVTGGQAYATIVFGSTSYGYVKANGNVYYPSYGAGTSSFTIPVKLNANNTIIGMTTAMSAAHEVTYTLYIYIAGADKASSSSAGEKLDNNSLSEKAPEIIGLTYMEEAKLEYAEYFKMYYYEDGITLIEIDMSSDTDRPESEDTAEETENTAEEKEATEETASTEDIEESSEEGTEVKDNITAISELYQNKVIRYLLVPEGVEIPVGLDKEMIVVNLPVENVYTDSEEAMDFLKNVGFIEEMEEKEFTLLEGEAGEKPDYKEMILNKIDFAILSDAFLWDEEKEDLTLDEQSELFYEITERLTTLGIPAIVDRSADEKTQEAAAEWIKVYGELFGCRTLAETLFQEATQC